MGVVYQKKGGALSKVKSFNRSLFNYKVLGSYHIYSGGRSNIEMMLSSQVPKNVASRLISASQQLKLIGLTVMMYNELYVNQAGMVGITVCTALLKRPRLCAAIIRYLVMAGEGAIKPTESIREFVTNVRLDEQTTDVPSRLFLAR